MQAEKEIMHAEKMAGILEEALKDRDLEKFRRVARNIGNGISQKFLRYLNEFRLRTYQFTDEMVQYEFVLSLVAACVFQMDDQARENEILAMLHGNKDLRKTLARLYKGPISKSDIEKDQELLRMVSVLIRLDFAQHWGDSIIITLRGEGMIEKLLNL